MNLPEINQLRETESTYITFSKAFYDLDKSIATDTPYYFTKMVALNLPIWQNPYFFIDLTNVGVDSTNPNICIPKTIQYYMENIIRQDISLNDEPVEEVTELAFYKMLRKMGLSNEKIFGECITFINTVVTSNFITSETNNGWGEIICQIPNLINNLKFNTKTIQNISDIVQTEDEDIAMYDNGDKQFLFNSSDKVVIDFDSIEYLSTTESTELNFNTLLLFYKDELGIEKLHGINFIYPYENKVTYWDQITFTTKTNIVRNSGYQFIFNQKTCGNQPSLQFIYQQNEDAMWWNGFEKTLTGLNSFLETVYPKITGDVVEGFNPTPTDNNKLININWNVRNLNVTDSTQTIISAFGSYENIKTIIEGISNTALFQFVNITPYSVDMAKINEIKLNVSQDYMIIVFEYDKYIKTLTLGNISNNITVNNVQLKPISNIYV